MKRVERKCGRNLHSVAVCGTKLRGREEKILGSFKGVKSGWNRMVRAEGEVKNILRCWEGK